MKRLFFLLFILLLLAVGCSVAAADQYPTIQPDDTIEVKASEEPKVYSFVPEVTGCYRFYCNDYRSNAIIYDKNMNEISYLPILGSINHEYLLSENTQYYLTSSRVDYFTGSYSITLKYYSALSSLSMFDATEIQGSHFCRIFSFVPKVSGKFCVNLSISDNTEMCVFNSNMEALSSISSGYYIKCDVIKGNQYYFCVKVKEKLSVSSYIINPYSVISWSIADNTLTISGYGDTDACDNNGAIAPWHDKTYNKLLIDPGITMIGTQAFNGSRIANVTLPYTVIYIKRYAFAYCRSMTSIFIPKNMKRIQEESFIGCSALQDIYFEGSETEWNNIIIEEKGNDSLLNATIHFNVQEINIDLCIPENTVSIESEAFKDIKNGLTVYIPLTTRFIAPDAFSGAIFLTIYGTPNTAAETYANEHGYRFVPKK